MNHWKKAVALIATVPMFAAFAPAATAADATTAVAQSAPAVTAAADAAPTLLASWDFTGKNGTSSGSIADSTGKYNLTLNGGVSVGKFGDRSNNEALNLNNDANSAKYAQIDDQLFKDAGDSFTLEFAAKTRHADDGNYFSLGVGKDNGNDTSKYLMFYSSTGTVKGVISDNGWHNEQGSEVNVANNNNVWHDYKVVVDGTKLAVYRDGTPIIFKADTGITMSSFGATTAYIGKSFYNADKYWNGAIDDIKVYKGAELASPTGVTISGGGVVDGKLALTEKATAKLTATVTPDDAVSKNVTWSSSDEGVAKVSADGTVTAVKAGSATITATAEIGGVKAELPVTVNPMDAKTAATEDLDSAISALKTTTTENLPLVAEGTKNGSAITWTSSDPKLITGTDADYKAPSVGAADPYQGAGVVTRPAYGDGDSKPVTLTATASYNGGEKVTKTVEVTVKEKTRVAPDTAYAAATFESDNANGGERIWMASTEDNDFFTFKTRNGGNPVITSNSDTKGLRDPYIIKSHEGDKYYMIATDLRVYAPGVGWGESQRVGSLKLEVWESTDMVNWTRTNAEDGDTGIKVNSDDAGMTWAPEAFWDDSLNAYLVFFSSRMYTDEAHTQAVKGKNGGAYNIVRYAITRDFKTYTAPVDWQDTGYSRIDTTVFKIGDYYYRLTKNEESGKAGQYITTGKSSFLERSKVLTAPTTEASPNNDPETGWQLLDQDLLPFEGAETIALNKGDKNQNDEGDAYILMSDSGGYQPFMTNVRALEATSWTNRLSQTDGWNTQKNHGPNVLGRVYSTGMPDKTRHGGFVAIPEAVSDAMKNWTTVQAVDSTTTLKHDEASRVLTATVEADDTGTVAGSVTFALGGDADGSWSETVKLDANGKASVTVPAAVAGDITAAYDGYTDSLVKSSVSDPVTVAQGENPTQPEIVITGEGVKDGEVTLKVGDELDLHASLTQGDAAAADDELVWGDPSDPAVVEYVDQGANPAAGTRRVKALKVGTATIIVSSKADPKVTAKLTVKVVKTGETDATTPNKGDTTKPETKPNGAAKPSGNGGGLSATGAAVASVTGAVALLAAAGIALTVWRKRQA